MDTWDAITSQRDVREFSAEPIDRGDLPRILEAGRRAPSAKNLQPWRFVVVQDRPNLERLSGVWPGAWHVAEAAAGIAVLTPAVDDSQFDQFDLGQCVMSVVPSATDLGIGVGHSAVEDQDLARDVLGHPVELRCDHLLSVGHVAGRPLSPIRRPDRLPLDDLVTWIT